MRVALLGFAVFLGQYGGVCAATQVTVAADGSGDYSTVQAAVDAAPAEGSTILIRPGVYREHITIAKPLIELRGLGKQPQDVVLTFDLSNGTAGGTAASASTVVTGEDFTASNLTFENSFSRSRALTPAGSQAVALRVTGDRAVFRHVRFLGYQDTLYADGKGCDTDHGPCRSARQYFSDCYIEGNVDFIFGDSLAWFENCEIHALAHITVMLTAQSKRYRDEQSGYVFHNCRVTAEPGADKIYLGRPWRWYSSVVFLNTVLPAQIVPEAWLEWLHDDTPSLPTVYYAEFGSTGPGARLAARDSHAHELSDDEAARITVKAHLGGWEPK